jgi:hypothetical protein
MGRTRQCTIAAAEVPHPTEVLHEEECEYIDRAIMRALLDGHI